MKKYSTVNLIAAFVISFSAWVYCIAVALLGLIYQAYPGQENTAILIGTLPTIVTLVTALCGAPIMKVLTRKWAIVISLVISFVCGLAILLVAMPLPAVIACSAILGIPAGLIPAAISSTVTIIAPLKLKDKVIGWHNGFMMLGMAAFTAMAGIFAASGNFRDGYKAIFVLIPIIIIAVILFPNVDKDLKKAGLQDVQVQDAPKTPAVKEKMPAYLLVFFILYLVGCIFWNAWFVNYSDLIINEKAIGDAAVAGLCGSLATGVGCISGFLVSFWIKGTKWLSMPLAFVLSGGLSLLIVFAKGAGLAYFGSAIFSLFNIFQVSGLTTYMGLASAGKSYSTFALSLITVGEGAGVFLAGYVLPLLAKPLGGGASANIVVGAIALLVLGGIQFFFMKGIHKKVYGTSNETVNEQA